MELEMCHDHDGSEVKVKVIAVIWKKVGTTEQEALIKLWSGGFPSTLGSIYEYFLKRFYMEQHCFQL